MGRSRSRSRDRYRDNRKRSRSRSRSRERDSNRSNNRDSNNRNNNRDNNRNNNRDNNDDKTKSENDNIVKALVTENDGEISCSIEETNRIRALLGLKPLNNEKPKEKQAVDNFKAQKEDEEKRQEAEKLKEQINKAKNKRLLNEKLKGGTLGEVDNNNADESLLSAADWVKRSRKKELTDKEKADLLEKRLLEEEEENKNNYSSKDLKGIQIRHSIKDFEVGESVILTLADTNVLDDNDNLNDEGPVLENVNMTDAERRKEREKKIKRSKLPAYVAYDDEEFDEPGKKRSILSQYDEDKKSAPKLVLGEQGLALEIGNKKSGNINFDDDDDEITLGKPIPQSLKVEMQEAKDFYTSTEYAQFQKPKKKKRRIRQKKDDDDEGGGLASLESALLQSTNDSNQDRGSRSQMTGNQQDAADLEAKNRYQQAVDKSNQNNRLLNKAIEIEDDDAEMAQSLARARRIALLEQKKKEDMERIATNESKVDEDIDDLGASRVIKLMKENKSNIIIKNDNGDDDVDTEGRTTDGKLVFTKTTEFTARLQARLNEDARLRADAAIQKAISSSSNKKHVSDDNMDIEGAAIVEDNDDNWEEMDVDNKNDDNDDDDSNNDDQLGFIHDQPLVARGMAATLNLLKGTGELKRQQTAVGRANDERDEPGSQYDNDIQLEYRDDQGRLLTKKEAFRKVCYDFHGYGAGKNKRDKRIKSMQLETKNESSRSGPAGTMLALNQVQKATGKAFLKLN